jgi:DNA-binding beta-propeller fold protein YncE
MIGLSGDTDVVIKYNLRDFTEIARADVGKDAHVTLSPNRRSLYVAAQNSDEIRVLRRRDLTEIAVIDVPAAHGIDITRNGRIVYATNIANDGINALYTIDTRTNSLIGDPVDTPYATPHNIVLTRPNNKLYVTHSGASSDKVSVFGVSRHNPEPVFITTVTTGLNPFGIEFVPFRRW